jgi:uncharacterized protein
MTLQEKINEDLKVAMKAKKEPDLTTLRMIKSDIQYELTKTGTHNLNDESILQILRKNLSKRKDTAIEYRKANRIDLAEKEETEALFIESYMPPGIPEEEILQEVQKAISELNANSPSHIGKVTGKVMAAFKGKNIDGSKVSNLVKESLSKL